ncbi:hypothetical protein V2G26_012358 [Clonostachys chloroleuca]
MPVDGVQSSDPGEEKTTHHPEKPGDAADLSSTHKMEEKRVPLSEEASEAPYTIFSAREKASIIVLVSFLAIISPLSGSVYLPALTSIADSLQVSISLVNLTVTTYLVSLMHRHTTARPHSYNRLDLSRHCAVLHWQFLRFLWPPASICNMLCHLPRRQYWPSVAE